MLLKPWFKKDIKWLKQQVDTFVLQNKMYYTSSIIKKAVEEKKQVIVMGNAQSFRNLIDNRANENWETVKHAQTSGVWGPGTSEIVERFTQLAKECEKDVKRIDKILARIEKEGLPEEVLNYMPDDLQE